MTEERAEEIVEVVARAIFRAGFHPDELATDVEASWHEWEEDQRAAYRKARAALAEARPLIEAETREKALDCQPSTAEDPNESSYQRGRFDGIMEFAQSIRSMGGAK